MPLSPRGRAFLAALRRHPAVPVTRVAEAIREAGCPVFDIWLDFHERYAGYEEPMGKDTAIYGIVHTDSYWLVPGKVWVKKAVNGTWSVACAEAHGSYDFRLYQDGCFRSFDGGGPCETFDVNMEQHALIWEVKKTGRIWTCDRPKVPAGGLEAFREAVEAERVAEASDRFNTVWKGRDAIWFESPDGAGRIELWAPKDRYQQIRALLSESE